MTHHPHVHMIVPGGGLSHDGSRWIPCRSNFFLSVRVLSRLFRRLFLENLVKAHDQGQLHFFGGHASLADRDAFDAFLDPFAKSIGSSTPRNLLPVPKPCWLTCRAILIGSQLLTVALSAPTQTPSPFATRITAPSTSTAGRLCVSIPVSSSAVSSVTSCRQDSTAFVITDSLPTGTAPTISLVCENCFRCQNPPPWPMTTVASKISAFSGCPVPAAAGV